MTTHGRRPAPLVAALTLCLALLGPTAFAADGWVTIDYGAIVERRAISHSGQTAGELLDALDGRPRPRPGEVAADLARHRLLEPLVERLAFVLPDAVDARQPLGGPPWIEVGLLWDEGAAQPAWAELLRAGRLLIESDGAGRLRAFLPLTGEPWRQEVPPLPAPQAAEVALRQSWSVVRLVVAAERRRLDGRPVELAVRAYRHLPERSSFHLGVEPWRIEIDDTRPAGIRPPLDPARWAALLDGRRRLEGGRIEADGALTPFTSDGAPPTILGRPLGAADLAVAYRAVFHGGLAEPYMSLDRGFSPQTAIVNYGGRLRDTALGLVSLLCDVRFKTFSMGLDIASGADRRAAMRVAVPGFRTHLEALAAHPDSAGLTGQQTRLWFYPDDVDVTLAPSGDVMAMRRVRMSAASERVDGPAGDAGGSGDPPWTVATVASINRDYGGLAGLFPELADLDEVVRLLAFFTWVRDAAADGWLTPELDALLDVELPALTTPRTYPQLLSYDALPPAGSNAPVAVFDRAEVGAALERLNSPQGPLAPRRRFARAARLLDPGDARHASLVAAFRDVDPAAADPGLLDLLAFRAERLRMHQTVLATLDGDAAAALEAGGVDLRRFSLAIGGLDLGMGSVLDRARRAAAGGTAARSRRTVAAGVVEAWRVEPTGLGRPVLPTHGASGDGRVVAVTPRDDGGREVVVRYAADGPGVHSRRLLLDAAGTATRIERVERGRALAYTIAGGGEVLRVDRVALVAPTPSAPVDFGALPAGLAALEIEAPEDPSVAATSESPTLGLRLGASVNGSAESFAAEVPRAVIQRLVTGPAVDLAPGQPLGGLAPLPPALGGPRALMVAGRVAQRTAPWEAEVVPVPGEEHPAVLAHALNVWWRATARGRPAQHAFVGVEPLASAARWAGHAGVGSAVLLVPRAGTPPSIGVERADLAAAWGSTVVEDLAPDRGADLIVVVSAEPPDLLARRLRELAARPDLAGRALAVWSLGGRLRNDTPAALLSAGRLAAVGIADDSIVARRTLAPTLAALAGAIGGGPDPVRVEALPGPFVWFY